MDRMSFAKLVEATRSARPLWFDLPPDARADTMDLEKVTKRLGVRLPDDYAWFLGAYGGGDFAFASIYSADESSDLYVVSRQPTSDKLQMLVFSDNGCGDDYVFPVREGVATDLVLFHDHETGEVVPDQSDGFLDFVARHALRRDS
jgi:hypothetical protein